MVCVSNAISITAPGQWMKWSAVWFLDGRTRILNEAMDRQIRADPWVDLEPGGGAETSGAISPHPLTRTGSNGSLLSIGEPLISMILD